MAADWATTSLAEAGFRGDIGDDIDAAVADGRFAGLHGVVVVRDRRIALERYYAGEDRRWNRALGHRTFGADELHDLRSVSKSIVGLLYGIALADGLVPGLEASLVAQFSALADLAADPARRRLSVRHALSMTLGTEWNEDLPYSDPRNGEIAMEQAPDRYRFVLDRPIVGPPGETWRYCGGASALLGHFIARGAGQSLLEFARARLFDPLGIGEVEWISGSNGEEAAASGLRMAPRDLARIGQLMLDGGRIGEATVVPAAWIETSTMPAVTVGDGIRYGLHWWLGRLLGKGKPWWSANGNGGQRLFIAPSLDCVLAIACGNYDRPDNWRLPVEVINRVLDGLRRD